MALPNFANVFIDFTWLDIRIILEKDDIIIIIFLLSLLRFSVFVPQAKKQAPRTWCAGRSLSARARWWQRAESRPEGTVLRAGSVACPGC